MKKMIAKWQMNQDIKNGDEIIRRLRKFWSKGRRKIFVNELIFNMDYTNDELVTLANEIGRLAHERDRVDIMNAREDMPS